MGVEVSYFADEEEDEAGVGYVWVGRFGGGGGGAIDPVGHVEAGEEPVVCGIFEDVEEGHGGRGEAVNEEGFELAF